ncbi:MAG: ATP-binding protein [Actinomycetota bacterium]|nr:ATP-binding protein [Actinomycetota bacterium]
MVFEIMHSVSAMILVAVFLPDRTYLSEDAAAPFATYAAGVAGLVVLLPRHAVQGGRLRRLVGHGADLLLPLTLYPVFTAAAFLNGYSFGELDFGFLTLQVSWTLVGVLLGYLILGLSRAFVDAEVEILRNTYESFSDWLHSEIKGDIAAMRGMLSQDEIDRARLTRVADDLERKVGAERLRLLLGDEELSVADILAHNIERFAGAIRYDRIPAVGGWVVSNRAGLMLNRVLGDLLSNAVKADAVRVTIDMARDDSRLSVTIADDGPGFDASVLDDDSTSLGRLRRDLERDRGALAKIPTDSGSIVAAVLRWGE